jgi:MtaA/CmuA family methyltransferase
MSDRLAAIIGLREQVGDEVPIMGWVEGALAEAAVLRGVGTLMTDVYDRPNFVKDLLDVCVEVEIAFARAQIEAGADIVGLGDAVASQISPVMYREYALPYERRIVRAIHEMGGLARLHICGDTTQILEDMVVTEADIIDIDWMVDMATACRAFGGGPSVCGNFDPVQVMLEGTPEDVYEATRQCMAAGGDRSISAAGCEIPRATPHENLRAQRQALEDVQKENTSLLPWS